MFGLTVFAPAQLVGYLAFLIGVTSVLQKNDRRLKVLNACQCTVYAVHFFLLGNPTAAASSVVSMSRSSLSLWTRSPLVAAAMSALYLGVGLLYANTVVLWLTVIGSAAVTLALFLLDGIPLRLVMLGSTVAWLLNNIVTGSIGGTMLELTIGVANFSTIVRLYRDGRR